MAARRYQGRNFGVSCATCSRLRPATPEVFGAHDAVDEADGEGEPVRVLQHPGEALGGGIGRVLGALGEPAAHEGDDVVGARREIRGGVRHGHEASVLYFGRAGGSRACRDQYATRHPFGTANESDGYCSGEPNDRSMTGGGRDARRPTPAPARGAQPARHPRGRRRGAVVQPVVGVAAAQPARTRGGRAAARAGRPAGAAHAAGGAARRATRAPCSIGSRRPSRMSRARSPRSAARCASPCSSRPRTPWCRRRSPCCAASTPTCASRSPSASPTSACSRSSARDFDLVIAEQYPGHTRAHRDDLDRVHLASDAIRLALPPHPAGRGAPPEGDASRGHARCGQRPRRGIRHAVGARAAGHGIPRVGRAAVPRRGVRARRALRDRRPDGAHPTHPIGQRGRACCPTSCGRARRRA